MKHFRELTDDELNQLIEAAHEGMAKYAADIEMAGLSHVGSHDLYRATTDAIREEYRISNETLQRFLQGIATIPAAVTHD